MATNYPDLFAFLYIMGVGGGIMLLMVVLDKWFTSTRTGRAVMNWLGRVGGDGRGGDR